VGPLLSFVRPTERLQQVLIWEGSLIDPVGGILGALVFHAVIASTRKGPGSQLLQFAASIGVGLVGGVAGTALLWLLLRRLRVNIQAPGLGVAASNRGSRSSVGRGVAGWVSVVSGMIAGCDRCAARGAVRGSA
jgi:hypothetical protein